MFTFSFLPLFPLSLTQACPGQELFAVWVISLSWPLRVERRDLENKPGSKMYDITCCGQETEKANSVTAMGSLAVGEL